jgi:gamma-glutamyltranspeptidase/glutathione hydrolase
MYSQYGVNQTKSTVGGLAVGVPGELRAWQMLHDRHGALPWKALFQPSIDLSRKGFPVNIDLANFIAGRDFILTDPYFAETYAPNGTALGLGDTCYRHRFANTLERLANEGADIFYANSTIATNTLSKIKDTGGIMTAEDLAGYKAIIREAAMITYRDKRIFSTVAPSSGGITLSALKIFEGFPGNASDDSPEIALTTQRRE